MISVIMLTYNRETLVGRAIESILAQTYRDFEFIIVDNGAITAPPTAAVKSQRSTPPRTTGFGSSTGNGAISAPGATLGLMPSRGTT